MVRLIQKSDFIKPGKAAGYIEYIVTHDGVEVIGADGYLEYMATRSGSHGLFGNEPAVSLNAVMKELEQFRWYAAYHDADMHPHIHMTVWSNDSKLGFLTPEGIKSMRSILTNSIFQDDLYSLYQQKDIFYKELTAQTRASMRELVMQMVHLAHELKNVSGKKVYGCLKKPLKAQVDAIVDELAKIPAVAECYEVWNALRDELESYYKDKPRQRLPLSQQTEFKAIKNTVIQEAETLRLGVFTFEDERLLDEPLDNTRFNDPEISNEEKRSAIEVLERSWIGSRSTSTAYQLSRVWQDRDPSALLCAALPPAKPLLLVLLGPRNAQKFCS